MISSLLTYQAKKKTSKVWTSKKYDPKNLDLVNLISMMKKDQLKSTYKLILELTLRKISVVL